MLFSNEKLTDEQMHETGCKYVMELYDSEDNSLGYHYFGHHDNCDIIKMVECINDATLYTLDDIVNTIPFLIKNNVYSKCKITLMSTCRVNKFLFEENDIEELVIDKSNYKNIKEEIEAMIHTVVSNGIINKQERPDLYYYFSQDTEYVLTKRRFFNVMEEVARNSTIETKRNTKR